MHLRWHGQRPPKIAPHLIGSHENKSGESCVVFSYLGDVGCCGKRRVDFQHTDTPLTGPGSSRVEKGFCSATCGEVGTGVPHHFIQVSAIPCIIPAITA